MRAKISHKLFMLVGESYSNMISHVFFERTAGRYIMSVTQRHSIALKCDIFFCPSPLPFSGSTVLSLTRGPAGNRTTTGSLSATQECRDTNCTTRTTIVLKCDKPLFQSFPRP